MLICICLLDQITEMEKVFIPIHVGENHWCMACINFVNHTFGYYDSMGGSNDTCLQYLRRYMADEANKYSGQPEYNFKDSRLEIFHGSRTVAIVVCLH